MFEVVSFPPGELRVDDPRRGSDDRDTEQQPPARRELLGETQKEELGGEQVAFQAGDIFDLRLAIAHQHRISAFGVAVDEASQLLAGQSAGVIDEERLHALEDRRFPGLLLLAAHTWILRPPGAGVAMPRRNGREGQVAVR